MARTPLNHELILRGRVLALRYTIAMLLMRMDRNQRLPYRDELDNLEWISSRVRKSLDELKRARRDEAK